MLSGGIVQAMITLSEAQYQEIQNALAWDMAERLPDGRVLGSAEKMGWIKDGPDLKVSFLADRVPLHDKTVLELGSYEGDLTVQLARVSKFVTGIEVRPSNIICAMTRVFIHDIKNARFVMQDVQTLDDSVGRFDVLFHAGLLYHMLNPVEHMYSVAKSSDIMLLNTHYYSEELGFPRADIVHNGVTYKAALYKEFGMQERLSGVSPQSRWLYREDLLKLVAAVGYDQIEVARDIPSASGPKITLLAKRSKATASSLSAVSENNDQADLSLAGKRLEDAQKAIEQSKVLFEAARKRAEFEEDEYRKLKGELKQRLASLENENERYKQDNDYFRQYAGELADTIQGITNSKTWKWNTSIRKIFSWIG